MNCFGLENGESKVAWQLLLSSVIVTRNMPAERLRSQKRTAVISRDTSLAAVVHNRVVCSCRSDYDLRCL